MLDNGITRKVYRRYGYTITWMFDADDDAIRSHVWISCIFIQIHRHDACTKHTHASSLSPFAHRWWHTGTQFMMDLISSKNRRLLSLRFAIDVDLFLEILRFFAIIIYHFVASIHTCNATNYITCIRPSLLTLYNFQLSASPVEMYLQHLNAHKQREEYVNRMSCKRSNEIQNTC